MHHTKAHPCPVHSLPSEILSMVFQVDFIHQWKAADVAKGQQCWNVKEVIHYIHTKKKMALASSYPSIVWIEDSIQHI